MILLQEAGTNSTGFSQNEILSVDFGGTRREYKAVNVCPDASAYNERCTPVILMPNDIYNAAYIETGILNAYSTIRTVPYLIWNGILFASLHAIADDKQSPQQVRDYVRQIREMERTVSKWVLMGDFNCTPEAIQEEVLQRFNDVSSRIRYDGTMSRPQTCGMVRTGEVTHWGSQEDKEYDYALVSDNLLQPDADFELTTIDAGVSDHNIMVMTFNA